MLFATFLAACFDWRVLQCEYLILQKQVRVRLRVRPRILAPLY